MNELRLLREEPKSHVFCLLFFIFFLIFYHALIVLRYKKLRAVLAMKRTKPINQNKTQKKPLSRVHYKCEINLVKTICQRSRIRETIYKEILTQTKIPLSCIRRAKINKSLPTKSICFKKPFPQEMLRLQGVGGRGTGELGERIRWSSSGESRFWCS